MPYRDSGLPPFFASLVPAGFPSPAEDYAEGRLDFNRRILRNPAATYCVRVAGDSMREASIEEGDVLVVDRSLSAISGDVVVASLDGAFTVKRLRKEGRRAWLCPENQAYKPVEVTGRDDFCLFGVVTFVLRELRKRRGEGP
jgi:DNA polymerase V